MELMMVFCIGLLVGCVLMKVIFQTTSVGSLRIDTSDTEDGPYLFLELSADIKELCKKNQISLTVNTEDFITRK